MLRSLPSYCPNNHFGAVQWDFFGGVLTKFTFSKLEFSLRKNRNIVLGATINLLGSWRWRWLTKCQFYYISLISIRGGEGQKSLKSDHVAYGWPFQWLLPEAKEFEFSELKWFLTRRGGASSFHCPSIIPPSIDFKTRGPPL